jgi:hypothetical protein
MTLQTKIKIWTFLTFLETKNIVHNLVEDKTKIFRKSLQWTKQKIEWNTIKWENFIYE